MKYFFSTLTLFIMILVNSYSQERPHDAYYNEDQTYFTNLLPTANGLVMTDNYASSIYLLKEDTLSVLLSAPGCGRYMKLSPDGKTVLFKYINNNRQQAPFRLIISSGKTEILGDFVDLCSQPVADNQNNTGYCITGNFILKNSTGLKSSATEGYTNYPALSGNGKFLVFNNNNDQLFMKDIKTGKILQITDEQAGYVYPSFSPDDEFLVFNNLGGDLFIYNTISGNTKKVARGGHVRWISDSEFLFTGFDENGVSSVSFSKIHADGKITIRPLDLQAGAMFAATYSNELFYTVQGTREIYKINLQKALNNVPHPQLIYKSENKLPVTFYSVKSLTKAIVKVPGTVPYVNQVYDTPSWHAGWGSCAPTTSVMAFAYYNRLPPWPVTVDHGQSWDPHVNEYGSYVADRYRFNEIYYSETADAYGTTAYGGYGYLWTGSYSPNSRMKIYIENHYMASNQLWTTSCTYNNTTSEIDGGYVHPICNYLTTSGHLTLATGYVVGQHTLIFNDPYGNKNNPGYPNYTGYDSYYDWPGYNNGYQNLDASGANGGVAWTVKAETSQPVYNDTIIDNIDYGHGFYMSNVTNGSHMRYFHDYNVGYHGHTWWTYTMASLSDICYVTWGPNLLQAGNYKVEVYIPSNGANTTGARYHVHFNGGDSLILLNQGNYPGQWVELGVFPFHAGQGDYVYLGDSTGIDNEMIAFDAMRWSFVPDITANFTSTNQTICTGDIISFTNTSLHADSCKWILTGSNLNVTYQLNPTVIYNTAGTYDVTLIAFGSYGNDTLLMPGYVTVNARPVAGFSCGNTTVQLPNAVVLFTNTSQNATTFSWNFGDGSYSTDQDPYHIYTLAGNYNVTLIASNGLCPSDSLVMNNYITVEDASAIEQYKTNEPTLSANNGILSIYAGSKNLSNVDIKISDEAGRTIFNKHINSINKYYNLPIQDFSGIILITMTSDNKETVTLKYVNYKSK